MCTKDSCAHHMLSKMRGSFEDSKSRPYSSLTLPGCDRVNYLAGHENSEYGPFGTRGNGGQRSKNQTRLNFVDFLINLAETSLNCKFGPD
jgi:hypothetical protein